jgi:hypothetical protein
MYISQLFSRVGAEEEDFEKAAQCAIYLTQRARGCVSLLYKQEIL